jgi:response regulator RpfG family c-di-GMP phosphodiesterase
MSTLAVLEQQRPEQPAPRATLDFKTLSRAQLLLKELVGGSIILAEDWDAVLPAIRDRLKDCKDVSELLPLLVEEKLLTDYQATRVNAGKVFGLVLGNYRVLERIGSGGMGVVYKAEHVKLRKRVALKVLPVSSQQDPKLLQRFYTEMRAIAQLQHTNIVAATDAGEASSVAPDGPVLHYLVMEFVEGEDLEQKVQREGPLPYQHAADLIHQVASALAEAHKHELVHRDIKPPNIVIAPDGQAKLLDFGLTRHFDRRMTEPGTMLGSIDYMAPEQAQDASLVDIRADIYALGGTLFWCVTGRTPFLPKENIALEVAARLTLPPPSVRTWRPDLPMELDAVVSKMMALKPGDRYATPRDAMRALAPFLPVTQHTRSSPSAAESGVPLAALEAEPSGKHLPRVLVVDDEVGIRNLCRYALQASGVHVDEAPDGPEALATCEHSAYDLVLLDIDMPKMNGKDVCKRLRGGLGAPNLKVVMFSGRVSNDEMASMLLAGADDYIAKPFGIVQLQAQVKAALRLKDAQDRSDRLTRQLINLNRELEQNLTARGSDIVQIRNALILSLAKLVEHRDSETGVHLMRLQRYAQCLANAAAKLPAFAAQIDAGFIEMIGCCAPLHDIGKVGLPDHILLKPGKLDSEERIIMQSHTLIAADTLQAVVREHGAAVGFLHMAIDIARHHHERWDGAGYPDGLAGASIPLAARIVSIGDVYDALRSRRVYKPALAHTAATDMVLNASPGQFDPGLLRVFEEIAPDFEKIFRELVD